MRIRQELLQEMINRSQKTNEVIGKIEQAKLEKLASKSNRFCKKFLSGKNLENNFQ